MPANQEPAPDGKGRPQGLQDPERITAQEQAELELPHTKNSPNTGGKTVRVLWPNDRFVVEGLPVMTNEGTKLAAGDVKKAQEAASASGVDLEVGD